VGVDCRVVLPHRARLDDVVKVMGCLAGLPTQWTESSGVRWLDVTGGRAKSYAPDWHLTSCAEIVLDPVAVGDATIVRCMFHFDLALGGRNGLRYEHSGRGIGPRSTPFWLAIGKGLVDFFGGVMDYQDCDDIDVDYQQPEREDIQAFDGEPWRLFQERIANVAALAEADLLAMRDAAAYDVKRRSR
jgi:hypothetical protein